MKKKLYFITAAILSLAVLSLSSCLKDPRYVDFTKVGTLIELPLSAVNQGSLQPAALPIQAAPQTLPLIVNIASPAPLSAPLTVTLGIDQAALDAYNAAHSTTYTLLPSADYSVANWKVTIPAGKRLDTLKIQINSSLIDLAGQFILPISIMDASGQKISNYKTVLYNVQAKNKYDGSYTVTGSLVDSAVPTITGDQVYPYTVYLETQSATTVAHYDATQGFFHLINNGGSIGVYGEFAPMFTFDPATNKVTAVTNYYGQPSPGRARAARIDVSGVNGYTTGAPGQAGSVFQVKYVLTQGGADRTFFTETYTYKGVRP